MTFLLLMTLFHELLFYWTAVSLFTAAQIPPARAFLLIGGCLCSAFPAILLQLQRQPEKPAIRYLCGLPACIAIGIMIQLHLQSGASMFSLPVLLFMAAPAAFTIRLIVCGFPEPTAGRLLDRFPYMAGIAFVSFLLQQVFGRGSAFGLFLFLFAVIGFLLLRLLRLAMSSALRKRQILLHVAAMAGLSLLCALLSLPVIWSNVLRLLIFVYHHTLAPLIFYGVYGIIWFAVHVIGRLIPKLQIPQQQLEEIALQTEALTPEEMAMLQTEGVVIPPIIFAVLKLLAVLAILYLLFRTLSGRNGARSSFVRRDTDRLEELPHTGFRALIREPNSLSPIRKLYRRYLSDLKKRSVKLSTTSTSLDVAEESLRYTDPETAGRIREIYVRERYGSEAVSDTEAEKELQRLIRKLGS